MLDDNENTLRSPTTLAAANKLLETLEALYATKNPETRRNDYGVKP